MQIPVGADLAGPGIVVCIIGSIGVGLFVTTVLLGCSSQEDCGEGSNKYHVYTDPVQFGSIGTVYCWPRLHCKVLTEHGLGGRQENDIHNVMNIIIQNNCCSVMRGSLSLASY